MDEYVKKKALLERLNYNGAMNMPPLEYCREVVIKFPAADVVEAQQVNDFIQRLRSIAGPIYHSELKQICKEFGFDYSNERKI